MTEISGHNGNGRKDYSRLLLSVLAAAWSVIVLAGAGWVSAIQSQVHNFHVVAAQLGVTVARLETRVDYLSRENADLRITINELERRALPDVRRDR